MCPCARARSHLPQALGTPYCTHLFYIQPRWQPHMMLLPISAGECKAAAYIVVLRHARVEHNRFHPAVVRGAYLCGGPDVQYPLSTCMLTDITAACLLRPPHGFLCWYPLCAFFYRLYFVALLTLRTLA
jgi:hypothetical protein